MDTRVLTYFLTVAREENITKAADILHITQPTLSRQLTKLEEDLGVQLFTRGKKGINLTDEGVLFRRRAGEITELAEKAERELAEAENLLDGEVSIGCGESESVKLIPQMFMPFKDKYPGVRLNIYTGNADQIKNRVDNGLDDLGILLEPVDIDKYNFLRLDIPEKWILLMRADDPLTEKEYITLQDLSTLPIIFPRRQSVINEVESWFGGNSKSLNIVAYSNLSTNASVLVEYGLGYALVIEGSIPYLDKTKITYRYIYPEKKTHSVIVWKKYQPFSLTVKKFLEHIQVYLNR